MKTSYDVIVCGGGPSGITAALAAGRMGMKTLLIEQYGFLGGASTHSLVYPWMSFHDSVGRQVIGGIAQEIVERLMEAGGSPGHLRDTIGFVHSVTPFDPEVYKIVAERMLAEANVDVLLHAMLISAARNAHRIEEIQVADKMGIMTFSAKFYIDATGDGILAYHCGVPFLYGRKKDGLAQPMTMNFIMGGVHLDEVREYIVLHPSEFHQGDFLQKNPALPLTGVSGFYAHWKDFAPADIPRDRVLFFVGNHEGQVSVNTSRVICHTGNMARDLNEAEKEGRAQVSQLVRFFVQHVPGFQDAFLSHTAPQIGIRETRHFQGKYCLSSKEILNGVSFDDVIVRSGYPVDIHDPNGKSLTSQPIQGDGSYEIPFRVTVPVGVDNLFLNGRCISVTHTAFSSTRLTPSCMAIGQAVGSAAGLCIEQGKTPEQLDMVDLQAHLIQRNAILFKEQLGKGDKDE